MNAKILNRLVKFNLNNLNNLDKNSIINAIFNYKGGHLIKEGEEVYAEVPIRKYKKNRIIRISAHSARWLNRNFQWQTANASENKRMKILSIKNFIHDVYRQNSREIHPER